LSRANLIALEACGAEFCLKHEYFLIGRILNDTITLIKVIRYIYMILKILYEVC